MLVIYESSERNFLQILGQYLRKETTIAFFAILMVLFVFAVGTSFAGVLRTIARGALPASMLYIELGLRSIEVMRLLLPLSLYLAILAKLAHMYRNQEIVMFHSLGLSSKQLVKMYYPQMAFFFILLLLLSGFIVPWVSRTSEQLTLEASKDVSLMGLKEGVFQELSGSNSIIYVRRINTQDNRLENIFINVKHVDREDTLTAEYAYQYQDEKTKQRYISLYNGFRNEGIPGSKKYSLMRFDKNDIKLPKLKGDSVDVDEKGKPLSQLMASENPVDKAEFHERISSPLVILVLTLLAVSISKTTPRDGKYGSLILGLLIYIVYLNLLAIAFSLVRQGKVPPWMGAWWVHLIFFAYALWRIHKSDSKVG